MKIKYCIILSEKNQKYVFIAVKTNDGLIAKKRLVTIGQTYNGMAEVLTGLIEGDQVISMGYQDVTDGEKIKL